MKDYLFFKNFPVIMANFLCLNQVKDQLSSNLIYNNSNPISFIYNTQLYAFTCNYTFIKEDVKNACFNKFCNSHINN